MQKQSRQCTGLLEKMGNNYYYNIPAINLLENRSSLYGLKVGRSVMLKQDLDK